MAMNLQWPIANAATDDCVQHCGFKARSQAVSASSFWSLGVCKSRGGKAWEKESQAWRQLDVMEAVPDHCNSQTLHWSASSLLNNELYWHCLLNVTVSSSWTRYYKKDLKILRRAPPPSCLPPHVYLTSRMWLFLPGLPPLFLHTVSDQKLEVGTAWERGYWSPHGRTTCMNKLPTAISRCAMKQHQNFSWAYVPLCLGKIKEKKDLTRADLSCSPLLSSGPLLFYPSLSSCRLW